MAISRRSSRSLQTQIRRKRVWARTRYNPIAAVIGSVDLMANFRDPLAYGAQPIGATVARVRVSGSLAPATNRVAVGVLVHTRTATAPEVPTPLTELHENWMFHKLEAVGGPSGLTGTTRSIEWDIKSMRKIEEANQTLWFSWEALGSVDWDLMFSVLLLLP